MANLKSILFGDKPEAVIESRGVTSQPQKDALTKLLDELQGPAPQVAVPVTPDQQSLIDQSAGRQGQAQGELDTGQQALTDLLNNPAGDFQQEVVDPLLFDFKTNIMPQISRGFGNQFFSSERQKQDRLAVEDITRNLVGEKSRFLREDRANQLGAAGQLQAGAGQRGDILSSFLESAGIGRGIEEQGNVMNEQVRQQLLQMLLQGSTAPTLETVGIGKGGSTGLVQGLLQGAVSNPKLFG